MKIILIAAMAANRVIGDSRTNDIPWYIPGEQHRFKEITYGHPLIMGRKTYESIGRPLPGRKMIIITRSSDYSQYGCTVVNTPEDALKLCRTAKKVFIIGGEEIYRQIMPQCHQIILTRLKRIAVGDVYFPKFNKNNFLLSKTVDILDPEPYVIETYKRRY